MSLQENNHYKMAKYVSNKELLKEIIESKAQGSLTPRAIVLLDKMIDEISKVFKYRLEEDREDCKAFAMEDVIKYWNRFDPEKSSNAFSYYTQLIKHGSAKGWRRLYPIKASMMISISGEHGIYNI